MLASRCIFSFSLRMHASDLPRPLPSLREHVKPRPVFAGTPGACKVEFGGGCRSLAPPLPSLGPSFVCGGERRYRPTHALVRPPAILRISAQEAK